MSGFIGVLSGSGGTGTDTNAIHKNVAAEIVTITEEISPTSADLLLIEDASAGDAKKKIQIGNISSGFNLPGQADGNVAYYNGTTWVADGYININDGYITIGDGTELLVLSGTGITIGTDTQLIKTTDGYVIINDSTGATLLLMDNVLRSEKYVLINNSVPLSNPPANMGYLYSDAGAGKWRSPSGTITTFGTADPHCPRCGRDFALEFENANYGKLSVCVSCMADKFADIIIFDERK